jgi:hypothetical protein
VDNNKQAILEAVAAVEKQLRPFKQSRDGVSYEDIDGRFEASDFGGLNTTAYIPARFAELSKCDPPLLEQVQDSGSKASANYRLTEHGWNAVDEDHSQSPS